MPATAPDYIALWGCRDVPPWELEVVLMHVFGSARIPDARSIEYARDEGFALRLEYTKSDTLQAIIAGEELTPADVAQIGSAIATDLLERGPNVVTRKILFTEYPVEGLFRRAASFQLFSVPDGLPRAGPLDWEHPCVLEAEAPSSSNPRITRLRLLRRLKEIELVLAALVPRMKGALSGDRLTWVNLDNAPSTTPSQLLSRGYRYPGLWDVGEYTDTSRLKPIARLVDGQETFPPRSELQLPENLEASLDRYDALPANEKLRFQRAAHWLLTAKRIHGISISGAHIALTNAAECLATTLPTPSPAQDESDSPFGPTRRFRHFIETYGGVLGPKDSSDLYKARSNLSHGHRLLDEDLGGDLFGRATATDRSLIGLLELAVRSAVRAWLHRPLPMPNADNAVDP